MSWTDADVVSDAWTDADVVAPVAKENTLGQEAKRQGGLFLRQALTAAASPLAVGGNALGKAVNAIAGRQVFEPSTDVVQRGISALGIPEAERPIEKFGVDMAQAAPAMALPGAIGPQMLGSAATSSALAKPGEETEQAVLGGVLGGILPSAVHGGKGLYNAVSGPLREGWRTEQMIKKFNEVLGPETMARVRSAVENARPGQTVGDIMAERGITDAASLVAMEKALSKDPRLAGAAKGLQNAKEAYREQQLGTFAKGPEVIEQAINRRQAVTAPMRRDVMEQANLASSTPKYLQPALAEMGMVPLKPDAVAKRLDAIRNAKGNKTNPTVQNAMDEIQGLLENATRKRGTIDAEEIYTLRKQAGNVINKFAKDNQDWDKRFTSGLLKDVQNSIDDAIEGSIGNTGAWNRYLDVYSKRSRGIGQMQLGEELVNALRGATGAETPGSFARKARMLEGEMETKLSPRQMQAVENVGRSIENDAAKNRLAANVNTNDLFRAGREGELRMPHVLSRTATVANAILEKIGSGLDQKLTQDVGKLMLTDPKAFAAKYMKELSPEEAKKAIEVLRLSAPVVPATLREEQ